MGKAARLHSRSSPRVALIETKTDFKSKDITAVMIENSHCESYKECEEWYNLFKTFDVDNDGYIPVNELKTAVRDSAFTFGLNVDEADALIYNVDTNKDNFVDFPEFSALMAKAKHMRLRRVMLYAGRSVLPKGQQTKSVRYLLQYNCFPPPIFLVVISLMQFGVYWYYAIAENDYSALGPVPTDSWMILDPNKKIQMWRFFTYMFIHIGYIHVLANLAVQILLGIPLELVHKFWRLCLIYLLGVMSGALLFFAVESKKVYLAGASGGVYTLLSAHIANCIINWDEMDFNWIRAIILSIFVGADVGATLYQRFIQLEKSQVSYVSHIGGFVAGLLLGVVILRNLRLKAWERIAYWISLSLYILFVAVCSSIIIIKHNF